MGLLMAWKISVSDITVNLGDKETIAEALDHSTRYLWCCEQITLRQLQIKDTDIPLLSSTVFEL